MHNVLEDIFYDKSKFNGSFSVEIINTCEKRRLKIYKKFHYLNTSGYDTTQQQMFYTKVIKRQALFNSQFSWVIVKVIQKIL